ncbi:NusG domain II-containing protein [Clostridium sp.]|uniref:NusG domain II-containing protein n=1 Tax=Clostridium sp. TaxID=1506 RepID=UPI001A41ADBE|nr:NusG domain II-containing protein [Clostridium sp.]MBK5237406.1 NusG domain II-containing protein [Clostridium sp.]
MKSGDKIVGIVLLIIVVIALSVDSIYKTSLKGSENIAVIKNEGKVLKTIDLNKVVEPREFTIKTDKGNYNIISVKHSGIRVKAADCPNQVDVKVGWISKPGQLIVCLPNKLIISIKGEENKGIDDKTF